MLVGCRCIIPLDNTVVERRETKKWGKTIWMIVIRPADGEMLKTMKIMDSGKVEVGKHLEFVMRAEDEDEREEWVKELKLQSERFSPINDQIMKLRRESSVTMPHLDGERKDDEKKQSYVTQSSLIQDPDDVSPFKTSEPNPSDGILHESMYSQPIACGWMKKRGGMNTSWRRRFFVLYPDVENQVESHHILY